MPGDHDRQSDALLKWGTRPSRTTDNGIRGGTRPASQNPPTTPPAGSSAVQTPAPISGNKPKGAQ